MSLKFQREFDCFIVLLERVAGIEPARSAWEADRLPLHHTRAMFSTTAMQSSKVVVKHSYIKSS